MDKPSQVAEMKAQKSSMGEAQAQRDSRSHAHDQRALTGSPLFSLAMTAV